MFAAETEEVTRWVKDDLEAYVSGKFKTFCKEKCSECGKPATKRFATSMSFVVSKMCDSFWCNECGRILCESCRYQHTCERLDQQKERNAKITHEVLAQQLFEAEAYKEMREEEQRAEGRKEKDAYEQERMVRKERRKTMAMKAKNVEDFLQGITRDLEAQEARSRLVREELLNFYPSAKRLALTLYNDFEHPASQGLLDEEWEEVKTIYTRASEIAHAFVMDRESGMPLDMRNPWDPPPPLSQDIPDADGGALGRGLL